MRSVLFWDILLHIVIIPYRLLGQPIGPIFKSQEIQIHFTFPPPGFLDPLRWDLYVVLKHW